MWICPRCSATNYNRGVCECCGYTGKKDNETSWLGYNLKGLYDDCDVSGTNNTYFMKKE